MKIKTTFISQTTIDEFAELHDLTLEIHERRKPVESAQRYYAHFECSDISDGSCLRGVFGNGATPEDAIQAYAQEISLKRLILNAASADSRREIAVPRLI